MKARTERSGCANVRDVKVNRATCGRGGPPVVLMRRVESKVRGTQDQSGFPHRHEGGPTLSGNHGDGRRDSRDDGEQLSLNICGTICVDDG